MRMGVDESLPVGVAGEIYTCGLWSAARVTFIAFRQPRRHSKHTRDVVEK